MAGTGSSPSAYPLRLEADLEPQLSRWLWLVKWFLLIPHFICLLFLWIALVLADVRCLLRAALHRPLPARHLRLQRRRPALDVASRVLRLQRARHRPLPAVHARGRAGLPGAARDRLSRSSNGVGLPLIGWWLLGIPQYAIAGTARRRRRRHARGGLDRRPRPRRRRAAPVQEPLPAGRLRRGDGLQPLGDPRCRLRLLMTPEYPPFRLDVGGQEPPAEASRDQVPQAPVPTF